MATTRSSSSGTPGRRRNARTWSGFALSILVLLGACSISSCSTTGTTPTADVRSPPPRPPVPDIPERLLQSCPDLPLAANGNPFTLMGNHDQVAELYHRCSDRQGALATAVRELQATAWRWYCDAIATGGFKDPDCKPR